MAIKFLKNRFVRIGLVLLLFMSVLTGIGFFIYFSNLELFVRNPHFILRTVNVSSTGWWNKRSDAVCKKLKIELGKQNLFELPLEQLRLALEAVPSIETVKVQRVLPDTLNFQILEKIPRAYLGSRKTTPWLVDDNAVIMAKKSCVDLGDGLPEIISLPHTVKYVEGGQIKMLKPAMELLQVIRREYPDFRITALSVKKTDQLDFVAYYKSDRLPYVVIMPSKKVPYYMDYLKSAIKSARQKNDKRRTVCLLYDGNVTFDYAPWQKKEGENGN